MPAFISTPTYQSQKTDALREYNNAYLQLEESCNKLKERQKGANLWAKHIKTPRLLNQVEALMLFCETLKPCVTYDKGDKGVVVYQGDSGLHFAIHLLNKTGELITALVELNAPHKERVERLCNGYLDGINDYSFVNSTRRFHGFTNRKKTALGLACGIVSLVCMAVGISLMATGVASIPGGLLLGAGAICGSASIGLVGSGTGFFARKEAQTLSRGVVSKVKGLGPLPISFDYGESLNSFT